MQTSKSLSAALRTSTYGAARIAQLSCGTEWSGIQPSLQRVAESVGGELVFPEASVEDVDRAVETLGYTPASHSLRTMMGQALVLVENEAVFKGPIGGVILLTCFRCAEGSLIRHIIRRYLQKHLHIPVISYSFTERTKPENLLLRFEALANLVAKKNLLKANGHKGLTLGVDSGSSWTKAAVMRNGEIIGYSWVPTTDTLTSAEAVVKEALTNAQVERSQLTGIGVTGYGRFILAKHFHANVSMEEISVCAKGATYLAGLETGDATVLDIGGNDNKAITVHSGFPDGFTVGGICAGASGRFLEVVARRIGVDIKDFGDVALKGDHRRITMNAYCIVFGIQDLVSSLAMGQTAEDVAAAACRSVAEQFFQQQLQELDLRQPVVQVGGTALNVGLVKAIEEVTKTKVVIPDYPQYAGAVGAAVLASAATHGDE